MERQLKGDRAVLPEEVKRSGIIRRCVRRTSSEIGKIGVRQWKKRLDPTDEGIQTVGAANRF